MTKKDLIDAIATEGKVTKVVAGNILDGLIANISQALQKGDKVSLVGFGTFSVSSRAAREGRNPSTGKSMKIAAKKVAKFKPGKPLVDLVNS
ncbi:MAG: DNA-binding protein HU [Deltaproteobacteria bacterium RIFOXYD12_FULL_50_9]|nr:MAG: DNA-binding protein HU [Deltaproteobacteria bacterium RIFOXYD12_FULL_50_9]